MPHGDTWSVLMFRYLCVNVLVAYRGAIGVSFARHGVHDLHYAHYPVNSASYQDVLPTRLQSNCSLAIKMVQKLATSQPSLDAPATTSTRTG